MKKNIILTIVTCILFFNTILSHAANKEVTLYKQIKKIETEFKKDNFSNIEVYGNIVTRCNATPKPGSEFDSWKIKHVNDEALDLKAMQKQVKQCDKVQKKGYRELENLYKVAQYSGEKIASLLLARLIPSPSKDKVELLLSTASWSQEGVDLLGKLMLDNELGSPSIHRKFWLSVSNMNVFYPEEFTLANNELVSLIDGSDMLTLESLVADWQDTSINEREGIINTLKTL